MQGMFALFVDANTFYLTKDDSAFTWLSRQADLLHILALSLGAIVVSCSSSTLPARLCACSAILPYLQKHACTSRLGDALGNQ